MKLLILNPITTGDSLLDELMLLEVVFIDTETGTHAAFDTVYPDTNATPSNAALLACGLSAEEYSKVPKGVATQVQKLFLRADAVIIWDGSKRPYINKAILLSEAASYLSIRHEMIVELQDSTAAYSPTIPSVLHANGYSSAGFTPAASLLDMVELVSLPNTLELITQRLAESVTEVNLTGKTYDIKHWLKDAGFTWDGSTWSKLCFSAQDTDDCIEFVQDFDCVYSDTSSIERIYLYAKG